MSVDLEVLDILIECKFPPSSYCNFGGITLPELRRLSLDDLESWVRSRLPPTSDGLLLVDRFMSNLAGFLPSAEQVPVGIPIKVEVKQEPADSAPTSQLDGVTGSTGNKGQEAQRNNHFQPDLRERRDPDEQENNFGNAQGSVDFDSDVEIVGEVINVSIIGEVDAQTRAKKRILDDITLEDDKDDSTPTPSSIGNVHDIQRVSVAATKGKIAITVNPLVSASTSIAPNPGKVVKTSIFQLGRITRSVHWTMADFLKLAKSPSVGLLSIVSNCEEDKITSFLAAYCVGKYVSLPNLTTLKIRHSEKEWGMPPSNDVNYSEQLTSILSGSPRLHRIEICYQSDTALSTLLQVICSIPLMPSLTSLIIRHQDKLSTLWTSDLAALGQISAPNLEILHLACCIRAERDGSETKTAFEKMLQRFPNLTSLKIDGCFVTSLSVTNNWPKIVLDFPKLARLNILELGTKSSRYFLTSETAWKLPKRKKRKPLVINMDPKSERNAVEVVPEILTTDKFEEYFPVSINFPGIMPRLESIQFGVLYELQSLHFSELPILKIFAVSSNWAQFYPNCFPTQTGRRSITEGLQVCGVEILELPQSFQDCLIFTKILQHFHVLTYIYINLSTVEFFRSFAKTTATTGPESLQSLEIRIQFDFASSLDSCVLDKVIKPSTIELEKIKILKDYPHWKDYVKENQIELPQENPEPEVPKKFCGLGVLFKKLKSVRIVHIPRTLRIPTGPRHWIVDPYPEFTNTVIGFKEYPFSKAVEAACPPTMKLFTSELDMSEVAKDFKFEIWRFENGPNVALDPTTPSVKNEVKLEKSGAGTSK